MSQDLTPIPNSLTGETGSLVTLTTTTSGLTVNVLSDQYKKVRKLVVGETEWWVPGGRPIYRRLPAVSEAYQVYFYADGEIGYCLIPAGRSQFGAGSINVTTNEEKTVLLIYDGTIVWDTGDTPVLKTVVDLAEVGLDSGRWLVAYQRIYSDEPQPFQYSVTDYSLAGADFTVNDSASSAFATALKPNGNPWPYPGQYAFMNQSSDLNWRNFAQTNNSNPYTLKLGATPGFPSWAQPVTAWLEWFSTEFEGSYLPWKLDDIVLRTPLKYSNPPTATLSFYSGDTDNPWSFVQTQDAKLDKDGYYWEFQTDATSQVGWRVDWSSPKIEISSVTVSGEITLLRKPAVPVTRAQLAIYPEHLVPKDVVLCSLAIIDVVESRLVDKDDIRNIATRDYEPVADWLTAFADELLIENYAKVESYAPGFMAPPTLLKSSYYDLEEYDITVSTDDGPCPPAPPTPTEPPVLIEATVSVYPGTLDAKLIGASVYVTPPPGTVNVSGVELKILP